MTREETLKQTKDMEHYLSVGDRIHVVSGGNEWNDSRFVGNRWNTLYFFDGNGRMVSLTTEYIITKLEEDEQDTDTTTS